MTTPEVCQYSVSKFNIFSLIFKFCIKHLCCWLARARPGWAPAAASIRGRGGGGAASARHHRTTSTVIHNFDIDVYMSDDVQCCTIFREGTYEGLVIVEWPCTPVQLELGCMSSKLITDKLLSGSLLTQHYWGLSLRTSIPHFRLIYHV